MSGVVVGYVASPEGEAAVRQGIAEAKLRGIHGGGRLLRPRREARQRHRGGAHGGLDRVHAMLHSADVEHDLRHLVRGKDPVNDVLDTADEM